MDGTGLRFDEVAELYDRVRPGYPAELYDDITTLTGARPGMRVLEVGCGPGQATRDLLARGWQVHAVEPGGAMAERAVKNNPALTVDIARFEDWDPRGTTYDMLFAATAFHWVTPEVRWQRAAAVLEPGGALVLTSNRTVRGGTFTDVYRATEDLHARLAPEVDFGIPEEARTLLDALHAAGPDIGAVWEASEPKSQQTLAGPLFSPPVIRSYEWETSYDAADAVGLLSTFSSYLRVPPERRGPLLDAIADLVRVDFGGTVTRHYLAVLAVAHRR
jgi:SAM-dependent methyltransferase